MELLRRAFGYWVPLAIGLSGIFVFAYWAVQQYNRQSFNDPQIQLAEDAAARFNQGETPAAVTQGLAPVDVRASIAPWVEVYDASGAPIAGNAVLEGAPVNLPSGVFDTSTWREPIIGHHLNRSPQNQNRFTWQPRTDVRAAVVLIHLNNNEYVASGRNIREAENRIALLTGGWALAWGGTELVTLLSFIILFTLGWL